MKPFQVVLAGANPIQIAKGIENTAKGLVAELKLMSKDVSCLSLWILML